MNKFQFLFLVAICVVFSFLGGLLSGKFYEKFTYNNLGNSNLKINTKLPTKPEHIIKANEFQLVDKDGKVYASLGFSNMYKSITMPKLRLLTKAYGNESGVLISASKDTSDISLFGLNAGISMEAKSYSTPNTDEEYGESIIQVYSRPYLDFLDEPILERDNSQVVLKSGCGSPTRIEIIDKENNSRAMFGNIDLIQPKTGVETKHPASIVFFDKKGFSTWSAP